MSRAPFTVTDLSGVPFLDDDFAVHTLLAAVVAVRQHHAHQMMPPDLPDPGDVAGWLTPQTAVATRPNARPVPSQPMPAPLAARIQTAVADLAGLLPPWRTLMSLPAVYRLLTTHGALSASTYLWPQHVLLGEAAFTSRRGLHELVLHEMCHQWLYLIEELWPLDVPGARRVALPSGTPDRAPREVIGAAHVAAATIRLHHAAGHDDAHERIGFFTDYGRGCLALLHDLEPDLTDTGRTLARQLTEAL